MQHNIIYHNISLTWLSNTMQEINKYKKFLVWTLNFELIWCCSSKLPCLRTAWDHIVSRRQPLDEWGLRRTDLCPAASIFQTSALQTVLHRLVEFLQAAHWQGTSVRRCNRLHVVGVPTQRMQFLICKSVFWKTYYTGSSCYPSITVGANNCK